MFLLQQSLMACSLYSKACLTHVSYGGGIIRGLVYCIVATNPCMVEAIRAVNQQEYTTVTTLQISSSPRLWYLA